VLHRTRTAAAVCILMVSTGLFAASVGFATSAQASGTSAPAGPSGILPPSATPLGYSLTDMTKEVAQFTTSGNQAAYYPNTPFQILYTQQTQSEFIGPCAPVYTGKCGEASFDPSTGPAGTFTVKPGTMFYVPIANSDDSPPVIAPYPTTPEQAKAYFFNPLTGGGKDISITIDGKTTPLGPAYVAGPVTTAPLQDGGGTHIVTVGVFMPPLTPGSHTVEMKATQSSPAIRAAYQTLDFLSSDFTYKVDVSQ
jgi:hypothetical protein